MALSAFLQRVVDRFLPRPRPIRFDDEPEDDRDTATLTEDGRVILWPRDGRPDPGILDVRGQTLRVHSREWCTGRACCIHAPSDHRMAGFPLHWRSDRALMERVCPHGIGHPDPDSVAYRASVGLDPDGIHGCDGCCRAPETP